MSKRKCNLIIVAHPDDETLFFASLPLTNRHVRWEVVCVTDGNADGLGATRARQFKNAVKSLGAKKSHFFNLPDKFAKRLNQNELRAKLEKLDTPNEVYTHGPIGEYGHPHHQDVSFAVHAFFHQRCPIYSVAHNCAADKVFRLNTKQFEKKSKILANIYFNETRRFINFVPATNTESFASISFKEIKNIYEYLTGKKSLKQKNLHKYKWFLPYLKTMKEKSKSRPF